MTNFCNLQCSYCDWVKRAKFPLSAYHLKSMKQHLRIIKEFADEHFPEIVLVEYSGGEPFVYPEIVNYVLETFPDKWIRVITNGVQLQEQHLDWALKHNKTIIGLSLDGHNAQLNASRFKPKIFPKVIENVDRIVERGIPLMLLCTIHKQNIEGFAGLRTNIQKRFLKANLFCPHMLSSATPRTMVPLLISKSQIWLNLLIPNQMNIRLSTKYVTTLKVCCICSGIKPAKYRAKFQNGLSRHILGKITLSAMGNTSVLAVAWEVS